MDFSLPNKNLDTEINKGLGDFEWSDEVSMPPFAVNTNEVDEYNVTNPEDSDNDSDSGEKEEMCSYIFKNALSYYGSIYRNN